MPASLHIEYEICEMISLLLSTETLTKVITLRISSNPEFIQCVHTSLSCHNYKRPLLLLSTETLTKVITLRISSNPEFIQCVHTSLSCHNYKRPLHDGTCRMCEIWLPTWGRWGYWNTHFAARWALIEFGLYNWWLKKFFFPLYTKLACVSGLGSPLALMLLLANLASTKWCKKPEKSLKPWHIGIHLRVLSESYPMNTNMSGFRRLLKVFASVRFGQK